MNRTAVAFTLGIIVVSLGIIFAVSQWDIPVSDNAPSSDTPEWVLLQPQKCTEIPWRKAWAIRNQKPYADFPLSEEVDILTQYYAEKDVTILDVSFTYQSVPLCASCGCPEPFVFALLVDPRDAARLAVSGFTILDTSDPYVFTGPFFRQSQTNSIAVVTEAECQNVFATHTFLDQLFGSKRDSCFIQAAISAKNPAICANIDAQQAHDTCISELAVALRTVSLCDQLQSGSKNACITGVAGIKQDPTLCYKISDATANYFCKVGAQGGSN